MKVYTGPSPSVAIAIEGGSIIAERGKPRDVPAELGKSLLEQDTFKAAAKKKRKPRAAVVPEPVVVPEPIVAPEPIYAPPSYASPKGDV